MPTLTVSTQTYEQVHLLARAWNIGLDAVVERLLREFQMDPSDDTVVADLDMVPVYMTYAGTRTEGLFDPASTAVTVLSGEHRGHRFKSPSGAAVQVVRSLNPRIHANRNGWVTWMVTATGKSLKSLQASCGTGRGKRPRAGGDG